MKNKTARKTMLLIGIGFAALFWIMESSVEALIFNNGSFVGQILTTDPHEIWSRLVAMGIIIAFGVYAQSAMTKRGRIEEALRASEKWLSTTLKSIGDAVIATDTKGHVTLMNSVAQTITGWNEEDAMGKPLKEVFNIINEETGKQVEDPVTMVIREGVVVGLANHTILIAKDGMKRPVDDSGAPIRDDKGNITGVILVFRDVTERKRAEKALQASEKWLSTTLRSIGDAVIATDSKGQVTLMNPVAQTITGWNEKDAMGKPLKEVFNIINEETGKQVENPVTRVIREGVVVGLANHTILIAKDGMKRPVDDSGAPIRDDKGNITGVILVFRDITERKQMEHDIGERLKELQCLYSISQISERAEISLNEVCQEVADLLPPSWQYPEITCSRITVYEDEFRTENYRDTEWKQSADIKVRGVKTGMVEVNYLEERPAIAEGPFLKEERALINAVAEHMAGITQRKQAEEKLREAEAELKHTIEVVPGIIAKANANTGYFTHCNPALSSILGFSSEEFLARPFMEFVHPDDRQNTINEVEKQLKGSPIARFENRYICKDKTYKWLEWKATAADEKGVVYAAATDITERKRAEEELRESERKYRTLFEESRDAVFITTREGRLLDTNQFMLNLFGYTREEAIGLDIRELYAHPDDRNRFQKEIEQKGFVRDYEAKLQKKDGTEMDCLLTSTVWRANDGSILGYQGIIRDITERKRAEEGEKQLQAKLALSSRLASIGEMAAGVAHEINNPLTGIIGFSELLLRKTTDEKVRRDLETIHSEGLRTAKIVENLLTFARQRELQRKYADINDILKKALDLRAYELKTSNIEVVLDLASSLPKVMVDFHQVQEVLLNIILNADQAMTEVKDGGRLSIKTQEIEDYIRVSFTDDGPGISAEHLDKLFNPFFTTKEIGKGTGLGLSICHGIITEHGGRIYAKSKPGEGATFFIELPLSTEKVGKSKATEEEPVD